MSDYGKSKGKGGRGEKKGSRSSRSVKAGLVFPVGRTSRKLRNGKYADRIGLGAAIYLAAVLVSSNPTHISTFNTNQIRLSN
jgi:histone H2A